jgi:TrmH family RNA methyltransferase
VDVILVRPQRAANVAAACRAMKNMGLHSLILVGPPAGLTDGPDRALAYGAWDVVDGARRTATLREAVSACSVVAGTSGRLPSAWTPRRLAGEADALASGGRLGLVFGPEATGLTSEELALCHLRVHIPADPLHPSLNLAQAVLVLAYEMRLSEGMPEGEPADLAQRPPAGELESVLDHLRAGLLSIGYLNPLNPELLLAELRAFLWRARPTAREIVLLHGLARQVGWAGAEIARLRGEPDNPGAKGAP